jgi:hypothetical protein
MKAQYSITPTLFAQCFAAELGSFGNFAAVSLLGSFGNSVGCSLGSFGDFLSFLLRSDAGHRQECLCYSVARGIIISGLKSGFSVLISAI